MDIGIFTIAYNEYGRYIPAWCKSISESTIQPSQATVALFGNDHGLSDKMAKKCQEILPCLNIVRGLSVRKLRSARSETRLTLSAF